MLPNVNWRSFRQVRTAFDQTNISRVLDALFIFTESLLRNRLLPDGRVSSLVGNHFFTLMLSKFEFVGCFLTNTLGY